MTFILMNIPYNSNALEPYMSSETISFHHGKHHTTYVRNLNSLIENNKKYSSMSLEEIIMSSYDKAEDRAIYNNAGQVWNHNFFWLSMSPPLADGEVKLPKGLLLEKIKESFGSVDGFAADLKSNVASLFGSGWVWLVAEKEKLKIIKTSNADSPLTMKDTTPLICIDLWEHSFYLDYQNRKPEYVENFVAKLINWDFAQKNLEAVC